TLQATDGHVVVVTGVRRAAQTAQKIKQDADNVIDSIVADDIGKFPDTNVAQTLARVSGIQVRRDGGEANSVLIRGLPGISTLLNGREMFTTTGRYIQLADIPSTMLQRVDVYKSQSAELLEGGIAGVIDVRTNRPFDFKGATASAIVGARNQDKAHRTDPEASALFSNRWKTGAGEFGALVGLSYVKSDYFEERSFQSFPISKEWLWPNATGPDVLGLQTIWGRRQRTAANFAAQYRPNSDLEIYAEGLASHFEGNDQTDLLVGFPFWASASSATKIPGSNEVDTATSQNANTILSTQARLSDNKTSQVAVGAKWRLTPNLRLTSELARTDSKYVWQNPILDVMINIPNAYGKTNVDGGAYVKYSGIDIGNPANINLLQLFDRYGNDKGGSTDFRSDVSFTPASDGLFKEFLAGVRANHRTAESIKSFEGSVAAPNNLKASTLPGMTCTTPTMSRDYGTQNWYTPCAAYLIDSTAAVRQAVTGNPAAKGLDPGSFFKDVEKNYSMYVTGKIGFDAGPVPVEGVFGVRVTKTDSDLIGKSQVNGQYVDTPVGASGTDVLPSASFKAKLPHDLVGRVAYAKTLTRPNFAQLNPGTAYVAANGTTVQATAAGGNPNLQPFTGQNLDVALEWYFAPTGMLTGTVFRHNFDGYIINKTVPEVFQGIKYDTSRPFNTDKGHLQGLEVSYRQFFDRLPGWLGGFGMEANVSYMEGGLTSSIVPGLQGKPFSGMSKNSYNLVGLYERAGVSARLAYNWRSKFVQVYGDHPSNSGTAPARDLIAAPLSSLDGSLSYKFTPNLSVNLTGTNLLNFQYVDYWDNQALYPRDTRRYDRTVGLSLNWRN
ncbi:MAG: TonB-dependent receptor, partial [Massilia sp.]